MNTRRALLIGGAVLVVGAGVYAAGGRNLALSLITESIAGESVDAPTAHRLATAGSIHLIDIRRPDEWDKTGSGEGASRLDMRRKDFITELEKITSGDRAAPVALICARGVRSAWLNNKLTEAGFTNIIDVPEGMLGSSAGPGWLKRGLPIVKN